MTPEQKDIVERAACHRVRRNPPERLDITTLVVRGLLAMVGVGIIVTILWKVFR
jgi:hypothetical protein